MTLIAMAALDHLDVGFLRSSSSGAEPQHLTSLPNPCASTTNLVRNATIESRADIVSTQISEADKQAGRAKSNVESYAKDAKAEALKGVDKFDQKVEEGSAKAKGWFGGK